MQLKEILELVEKREDIQKLIIDIKGYTNRYGSLDITAHVRKNKIRGTSYQIKGKIR
nr:MAG TPA: hypothetical protein [Caudoviricetes sp.]DAY42005.1 MAG TPA: hypothetical protein [Caudoviricetes sp.]